MKNQKIMNARRILLALTFAAMLAIPTISARAQSGGGILDVLERIKLAQAQALEGSWAITVTPIPPPGEPQPPSFRAYLAVSRGGAVTGFDRNRPFNGPLHGTWAHLGGNEFAVTSVMDQFDVMGNFLGTLTSRRKFTVIGKDQFVGVANSEFRDAAGNITAVRCATSRGERIKIEPLAPQCESIPPPQ
jgi:hypothetical protein